MRMGVWSSGFSNINRKRTRKGFGPAKNLKSVINNKTGEAHCCACFAFYTKGYEMKDNCKQNVTSVVIPEGATEIRAYEFEECTALTSVGIPEGVKKIGQGAFRSCTALTSVAIPEGVTTIESVAFWECRELTSVTIPASVTEFGKNVFMDCSKLTIRAPKGSKAEEYAMENHIFFEECE